MEAAEALTPEPEVSVGAAFRVSDRLSLTAEAPKNFGDGMPLGPETHIGVGVELRPISLLPLRAGVARITDGVQPGGGAGLALGPLNLAAAALIRLGDLGEGFLAQFALSFGAQ